MSTNYYNILGVPKEASDEEIKKAFRKLAREAHPDKGGDTEKFQKIQEAYETLSDPQKRREYDSPSFNQIPQFGGNFPFEMFGFQMGSNRPQKRGNRQYTFNISLRDAYFGITKKFKVKREVQCERCSVKCDHCGGEGTVTHRLQNGPFVQMNTLPCNKCSGRGVITTGECRECNGGSKTEQRLVELVLDRGIESGKQFVIEGWGEQAYKKGEIPGDLVIDVVVDEAGSFKRVGLDLIHHTTITLRESIVGKEIVVPHFEGDLKLQLRGFGIINPNKQYTVYKKGMVTTNDVGNLHLRFDVRYPDGSLDESSIEKLQKTFDEVGIS